MKELIKYDDEIVKKFVLATLIWGGASFLFGLLAALQLAYWPLNMNLEWITFGRLRPLHVNGMLFGWLLIRYWRGQPPFGGPGRKPRMRIVR